MTPERNAEIADTTKQFIVLLLAAELPTSMCPRKNGYSITREDLPFFHTLSDGWGEIGRKMEETGKKLKEEGKYFHPGGGSVFMDYKNLRDRQPTKPCVRSVATRFRVDMTYEEIIQEATKVIQEWTAPITP